MSWLMDAYRSWRRRKNRAVFRFFDGRRTRAVDPYEIHRGLDQHPHFKWQDIQDAHDEGTPDRERSEAIDRVIRAVREVFALPSPDEGGLLASEVTDLLESYAIWVEDSKKKPPLTLISSPRAVGNPSSIQADRTLTTPLSAASS